MDDSGHVTGQGVQRWFETVWQTSERGGGGARERQHCENQMCCLEKICAQERRMIFALRYLQVDTKPIMGRGGGEKILLRFWQQIHNFVQRA